MRIFSHTLLRPLIACCRRVVGRHDTNPSPTDAQRINQGQGQWGTSLPPPSCKRSSILRPDIRRHVRLPRKQRKPPGAVLVRRTPRRPSVRSLRTCSSARTGGRGSSPRTPTLASVCPFFPLESPVTWAEGIVTQVRSASCLVLSGKNSTRKRKR